MKRILVPGTSSVQADFILACRRCGLQVFTCSNTERGPGRLLADGFELIDITDGPGVREYARRIRADVIYTVGSDVAMPSLCRASEDLGLPCFVSSETAIRCNSKHLTRERLGKSFPGNLDFQVLKTREDPLRMPFPFVLKPADSQGQRGVRLVRNREEYLSLFPESLSFSRSGLVIAEEFADGPEISVPAYMVDGEVWCGLVADRISWPQYPGWIIRGNIVPSQAVNDPEDLEAVRQLISAVAGKMGIRNGPAYCQIKFKNGSPVLMEVSPRLDGGHLWRVWEMLTGVNILRILAEHVAGNSVHLSDFASASSGEPIELEYFCQKPGEPFDPDRFELGNAEFAEWYYERGETIGRTHGFAEKAGYAIRKVRPLQIRAAG